MPKKIVLLLSGGVDSATALGIAVDRGYTVYPLFIEHGQIAAPKESDAVQSLVNYYQSKVRIGGKVFQEERVDIGTTVKFFGKTAGILRGSKSRPPPVETSSDPTGRDYSYVPARNSIFISLAAAYAESIESGEIWTGIYQDRERGFPDNSELYVDKIESALRTGGDYPALKVVTLNRLLNRYALTKSIIVDAAKELRVPLHLTYSCWLGASRACGRCTRCRCRQELGLRTRSK